MKNSWTIFLLILFGLVILPLVACTDDDDDDEPIVVVDFEGNTYQTVQICDQVWMAENLRSTILNDGNSLTNIQDPIDWKDADSPAYCWYNHDRNSLGAIYGALYNFHVIATGKICPDGWHVPSESDWKEFIDCLGGEDVAGGKLKEVGTAHWKEPNTMATDEFGFTSVPSGWRSGNTGLFYDLGSNNGMWSSTLHSTNSERALLWVTGFNRAALERYDAGHQFGNCVRCIQD